MSLPVQIVSLHRCPQVASTLADWHAGAFGAWLGGWTSTQALAELRMHGPPAHVPFTLVAFAGGDPVGSISLIQDDPPAPPAAGPWLASFFVRPDHRGRGIGGQLHDALVAAARSAGLGVIFLWTPDAAGWYEKRGWLPAGQFQAFGIESRMLQLDLTRLAP